MMQAQHHQQDHLTHDEHDHLMLAGHHPLTLLHQPQFSVIQHHQLQQYHQQALQQQALQQQSFQQHLSAEAMATLFPSSMRQSQLHTELAAMQAGLHSAEAAAAEAWLTRSPVD